MTMTGPVRPTRMSVDTLREKTWAALKAAQPKKTGTMPAVDHVFQAVYVLSNAGLDTKAVADALGVSLNYVRVARRNNARKLVPSVETIEPEAKSKRQTTAERKLATGIPNHSIDELYILLLQLPAPSDLLDAATLRRLGIHVAPDLQPELGHESKQDTIETPNATTS